MISIILFILLIVLPFICAAQLTPGQLLRVQSDGVHFELSSSYLKPEDTAHNNLKVMTRWVADSSIAVINANLATKMVATAFTAAAITALYGYTPGDAATVATNTSNIATNTTNIGLKVNIADTNTMLSKYLRKQDTSAMLSNYITGINTNAANVVTKLNKTDTAAMLAPYLRSNVAAATYQPMGSYLTANQAVTLTATGDATGTSTSSATAPSIPLVLATINSNVGTFNGSYTVNGKGLVTAATNASFNAAPSRALSTTGSNNTFTISASKAAHVSYTVNFAYALTLTTSNGYVELDYSTDAGSNWNIVASVSSVYSVSVTLTGNQDQVLSGEIPINALVRLYRINATNCTVTAPTTKQQEVTY